MHTFSDLGELLKELDQKIQGIRETIEDEKKRISKVNDPIALETSKIFIGNSGDITANISPDIQNPMDIEKTLKEVQSLEKTIGELTRLIRPGRISIPSIGI